MDTHCFFVIFGALVPFSIGMALWRLIRPKPKYQLGYTGSAYLDNVKLYRRRTGTNDPWEEI